MRIKYYLSIAMAALLMTNCSQEEELQGIQRSGDVHTLTATIEGSTRSSVTDGGAFSWTIGDAISVWGGNSYVTYDYVSGNDFSGSASQLSGYAIYPQGGHPVYDGTGLPEVNMSASYNYGSTNAIMLAKVQGNSTTLSFSHLGGLMRFVIKNIPSDATSFTFTAKNNGITGNFLVKTQDDGTNIIEASSEISDNNAITINFEAGQTTERTFYVPLPIGTYDGFTIKVADEFGNNCSYTSQAINAINRRTLLLMPTFTCNGTELTKGDNVFTLENTEQDMNVSGEEETLIIETPDSSDANDPNPQLNLNYTPENDNSTLNISDGQTGDSQDSKATVVVNVPKDAPEVSKLNIDAPTLTVELASGTYETVVALTAKQTLRIKHGVTVENLILNGGNIVIEAGATVETIANADGYSAETYVVNQGILTNNELVPENVHVVPNEEDIPTEDEGGEEEELGYELRVLTFEDEDAKFTKYTLDYAGVDIYTWSDLIDNPQYGGPLTYGDYMTAAYTWYDEGNTELTHTFPDNYAYCFWGGGHAISNYWGEGWSDEDRDIHIAKYYGEDYVAENAGNDSMLGWFNLQMMTPVKAHSGDNFAVHYGYKDFYAYVENLPEISFADGDEARVIDHMYVCNTNYTLNQLYNGVKSEAGNSFGGNWEGLTDDAWLKIVAYGFDDVDADAYAEPSSQVEFYLVEGKNVVTDWQKWDLSGLGAVKKVRFNFLYSDEMGGKYGFTIPGYFAYDDVAVRFEK